MNPTIAEVLSDSRLIDKETAKLPTNPRRNARGIVLRQKVRFSKGSYTTLRNLKSFYKPLNEGKSPSHSLIIRRALDLLDNKIIGVCRGRMEMGQRALGNRSIICDPRSIQNVEKINDSIKNRDFWMPFAPIILDEYQDVLIENPKKLESPHMTIAFETKNGKELIPASVHRSDGTARAQLLKKSVNPELWNLIYSFYEKTGIPAVLNTSLNLHGYPIVRTIEDALHVFQNSKLDLLWLENHMIEKI